jgi:hypothetical protein
LGWYPHPATPTRCTDESSTDPRAPCEEDSPTGEVISDPQSLRALTTLSDELPGVTSDSNIADQSAGTTFVNKHRTVGSISDESK